MIAAVGRTHMQAESAASACGELIRVTPLYLARRPNVATFPSGNGIAEWAPQARRPRLDG